MQKSQVPYVLTSCVSSRSFFSSPSPIFPQDAFQCFQDLKRIYLVCYRLLSSHCNAHAVNDSIFTGWLIDGNLKEKQNNRGACFTFHQSNYILKHTHTQKRLILNPISVSFLPTVIPFIRFLYVFLLSEISIPCFNHFKNLSVR